MQLLEPHRSTQFCVSVRLTALTEAIGSVVAEMFAKFSTRASLKTSTFLSLHPKGPSVHVTSQRRASIFCGIDVSSLSPTLSMQAAIDFFFFPSPRPIASWGGFCSLRKQTQNVGSPTQHFGCRFEPFVHENFLEIYVCRCTVQMCNPTSYAYISTTWDSAIHLDPR